jgi:hypothetical protein
MCEKSRRLAREAWAVTRRRYPLRTFRVTEARRAPAFVRYRASYAKSTKAGTRRAHTVARSAATYARSARSEARSVSTYARSAKARLGRWLPTQGRREANLVWPRPSRRSWIASTGRRQPLRGIVRLTRGPRLLSLDGDRVEPGLRRPSIERAAPMEPTAKQARYRTARPLPANKRV